LPAVALHGAGCAQVWPRPSFRPGRAPSPTAPRPARRCDPAPPPWRRHGFPRSHGPPEHSVDSPELKLP
jgi:hypothetical protein